MPYLVEDEMLIECVWPGTVIKTINESVRVKEVNVKQKYVFITFEDGVESKFEKGTPVIIERSELTLIEQEERALHRAVRKIRIAIDDAPGRVDRARSTLIEDMAMFRPHGHCTAYERFIVAQVESTIWHRVKMIASNREINLRDAAARVADEIMTDLLDNHFDSTSTSVMLNAVDAVETATRALWARRIRDMVAYGG